MNNPFLGDHPCIMGIVNVTPDSFSDGGKFFDPDSAIAHGLRLLEEGAHILDVGGESTRPGAITVSEEEEINRVIPVIEGLNGKAKWISVDTRNAGTMRAALCAGANIINDISALNHDPESINVAREAQLPVILMHMQGEPQIMQKNPLYNNVLSDVFDFFSERIRFCETHRLDPDLLVLDPGIGFGKTLTHNLTLLRNISFFHKLGKPVMLGTSRKSFLSKISGDENVDNRLSGSIASALWGLSQGVQIFRVHDVRETVQAFKTYRAISLSGESEEILSV